MARLQSFRSILILLSVSLFIAACGGGGGGGSTDLTPNAFSFTASSEVELAEQVESDTITVAGIEAAVAISISGGEYSINDGAYTSTAGTVSQGQTVSVRLTASSEFSTAATSTVTIGGISGAFSATTISQDTTPDNLLDFPSKTLQGLGAVVVSDPITVLGINDAATVTISDGGEYAIDSGDFTSDEGQITSGQTITVRLTASSSFSTPAVVTLTVGGEESEFTATTLLQDTTPETLADFAPKATQDLGAQVISDPITISNINDAAAISVSAGGEYSINGGAFTSDSGQVSSGQTVVIRLTASSAFSTPTVVTLTVGGLESEFTATTLLQDTSPETLVDFASVDTQVLEAVVNSASVTITNINDAADVTVTGGAYSIDSGDFTTSAGQVSSGQSIRVQLTTSALFETPTTVTLTVGGVEAMFTATTLLQDTLPETLVDFASADTQELEALVNSDSVIISNINDAADVTVVGGAYSIGTGDFTTSAGQISSGQSMRVQVTASELFDTPATVTITVGGVEASFTATTVVRDIVPNAFTITPIVDQVAGALVISDLFTVEGVNDAIAISVDGGATYSINSTDPSDFVTGDDTVLSGDEVRVRVLASSDSFGVSKATLTIGTGTEGIFSVRTALTFESPSDQLPDETNIVSSTIVAITDFEDSQAVSITGGEFSIEGGTYQTSGNIESGQSLRVRANASDLVSTDVVAEITVGPFSGTYTVTTVPDVTAPTAEIVFPPPVSMTQGLTLKLRGSAQDDLSSIESITLTVTTVASGVVDTVVATPVVENDTLESWIAEVRLEADTTNTITVATEDSEGNPDTSAVFVVVDHQSSPADFPSGSDRIVNVIEGGIALDAENNRLVLVDEDEVFTVNLSSGVTTELIDEAIFPSNYDLRKVYVDSVTGDIYISADGPGSDSDVFVANGDGSDLQSMSISPTFIDGPYEIEINPFDDRLYIADHEGFVFSVNLELGSILERSEAFSDDDYTLSDAHGLAFVSENMILVTDDGANRVFLIDVSGDNASFTLLLGPDDVSTPQDIEYDVDEERAIFVDRDLDAVLSVPVAGGDMSILSDSTFPNANNVMINPRGIAINGQNNIGYVPSENDLGSGESVSEIIVVDLLTGERVVLSRSFNEI